MKDQLTEKEKATFRLECVKAALNKIDLNNLNERDSLLSIAEIMYNYVIKEKSYTKKDLVSFGNYLLSEERKATKEPKNEVSDSDLYNWKK